MAGAARADVTVEGVDDAQHANILAYLDLDEEACDAPQWRIEQQYQASPAKIDEALEALGYYGATIRPTLMRDDTCWHAAFTVDPGEPVKIRTAAVAVDGDGKDDPAFKASLEQAALATGQVLNQGRYEALKRRWADLALERGYADAKLVANRIDVYPADHAADITLRFDTGPRYRFGDIDLQQDVLADRLVRSYVNFHPGDAYDATQLTQLYIALADSGYFSAANVTFCQAAEIEPLIAAGRQHHHPSLHERFAAAGPAPDHPTLVEAMAHRLQTPEGKKLYPLRKQTPEPVFGIIKSVLGFRQFLLRGLDAVRGEWSLVTLAWNMKRMFALSLAR